MRFAHGTGIIHRDLKPHNVMLGRKPSPDFVKVLDFGIARLADSQKLTRVGEIIGSPLYMSPEQCLDDPVDARTDIYSFGILMYLCLTGTVPFKGTTLYETVEAKCTQPIPRFKDVAPHCEIPNFLEELVRHCIAVEPGERFQTMDEVKDMLESIQVGQKKIDTMESTAILGTSLVVPDSVNPSPKRIREKMQRAKTKWESPSASPTSESATARSKDVAAGASAPDVNADRHVRSRHMEAHRGIVLTPRVMIIGFVVVLSILFAGIVVGVSFVGKGTFVPQQSSTAGSSADTAGSAKENGQEKLPSVDASLKPAAQADNLMEQAHDNPVATPRLEPQTDSQKQSHSSPAVIPKHQSVSTSKKVKRSPRRHTDEDSLGLPKVRHTVPSDRGAAIWYEFDKRD